MSNGTIVMPATPRAGGILLSALCHVLILLIPLSLATQAPQAFPPVEFVMTLAEKPMASETPLQAVAPPKPEPVRPQPKIKPRPRIRPVVTEPVATKTFIPQPVAAAPKPSSVPRQAVGGGSGSVGPIRADFGSATGPAFLRRVTPVYPEQARRLGQEGRVVLRLSIDARGNLLNVVVLQGPGFGFEEAAVAAVRGSAFRPAMVNGQAVASIARLPIRFALRH
jgi:periplasmic protein TonB